MLILNTSSLLLIFWQFLSKIFFYLPFQYYLIISTQKSYYISFIGSTTNYNFLVCAIKSLWYGAYYQSSDFQQKIILILYSSTLAFLIDFRFYNQYSFIRQPFFNFIYSSSSQTSFSFFSSSIQQFDLFLCFYFQKYSFFTLTVSQILVNCFGKNLDLCSGYFSLSSYFFCFCYNFQWRNHFSNIFIEETGAFEVFIIKIESNFCLIYSLKAPYKIYSTLSSFFQIILLLQFNIQNTIILKIIFRKVKQIKKENIVFSLEIQLKFDYQFILNILSLLFFLQLMQQKDFTNQSAYRIKKYRNNYLYDDHMKEDDDDVFKMSIHTSSNKTPQKASPKKNHRNHSVTNKNNDLDKFSHRSKRSHNTSNNRSNMSSSNVSGGSRKIQQSKNIKQFANVKQLLMIKAYDKKLLRNVTGSNQANKNFLKLGDVRNDPFRKETFKVMIQNFKQLTIRIRKGYEKVLNKILFQNTSASAIQTLASVQPLLQKVRVQADDMCFKVKQCQQTHDSRQFRGLLQKFLTFLNAAEDIQQIILIVNESKNRIDNLFKNLEKDKHLDEKVNVQRKKGIKKVRNAVKDYGIDGIQAKILDKVQAAINQMADKNLQAYSKINGARALMIRIKDCLQQNKQYYQLDDIVKINQIFKQVLYEAKNYEKFVEKFMQDGDIINDDLRACIIRYREQVQIKKQAVETMQLKFISNILQTSINSFEANYSVCNAIDSEVCADYVKVQRLLESICELISNQNAKVSIKGMLKDIAPNIKHIQKQIKKLKSIPKSITIDTEEGLQSLIKTSELINEYKKNIREIIDSEQRTYRQVAKKRIRRQNIKEEDLEQISMTKIISISKKFNDPKRKQSILKCKAFQPINKNEKVQQFATQIGDIKFYKQFRALNEELQDIEHKNELSTIITDLKTHQKLYMMSALFVDAHQIASSTTQQNLLKSIENINLKHKIDQKNTNFMLQNFIQRIYCLLILKGLDKRTIKLINDNKLIVFPENQHDVQSLKRDIKYLKTVGNILPEVFIKNKISLTYNVMEQLLQGVRIAEQLKWNKDKQYYIEAQMIFKCISDTFKCCFLQKKEVQLDNMKKNLKNIIENLQKLQKKQKHSQLSSTRVEKIIDIINNYEAFNKKLYSNLKKMQNFEHLQAYSQLVFSCAQYLTNTLQSFNATVNKDGNVLWLCQYQNQNPKNSKFGQFIGLGQLKPGQNIANYNQKIGIKPRKQKPQQKAKVQQKKQGKKKKKSQIQDMDEQINQNNEEIGDDMIEDMGQQPQDDMELDMPEENMDEEMGQQMQDLVEQDDLIQDVQDDIINDIDDDIEQSNNKKKKQKESIKKQTKKQQKTSPVTKVQPQNIKNDSNLKSPQKTKKQTQIIIKQKNLKRNLQKFKYIQTLQDLEVLLQKMRDIRVCYWKSIDLKIIQQYLNRQGKDQIQKLLIQELQKFCKAQYIVDFIASIKNSEKYKGILKQIDQINCLKFGSFVEVLKVIKKQYACLMGVNKELLRLSLKNNDKWQASQCIDQYVKKQLKSTGIKVQDFNLEGYIDQLIKNTKKGETKYQLGDKKTQLKGQQLKQKVERVQKIIKDYNDISKFPDNMNLYDMILKMWYNCLQIQKIEIEVPAKLDSDIDQLRPVLNPLYSISYLINLKKQANRAFQLINSHLSRVQNIIKTVNKDNILQKINQAVNIYKVDRNNIILFEKKPIFMRQITKSTFSKPEIKPITFLLLPSDQKVNQLTSQTIRSKLKSQLDIYAQFHKQISIILSMLQIQCHIWPSSTQLHINQNRDQIIKIIITNISNGVIKDAHEQLQNLQEVNKCLIVTNHQPLIFEYRIKEDAPLMSAQNNQNYYKQFLKIIEQFKIKKSVKCEVGDTIFQNIFRLDNSDNSITTQVFDYTQTLSLLLKQKVFQDSQSIYMYHVPTQTKLDQIKKQVDSEVRLLLSIVEQPIEIDQQSPIKALSIMQQRNNLVVKWYKEHRKIQKKNLSQINICACIGEKCDKQYTLYVGEIKNHIEDYLEKLTNNNKIYENYIKKHVTQKSKSEYKQSKTIHTGKIIKEVGDKLKHLDPELYCSFINSYNFIHFIRNQNKNKGLLQAYNKLVKENEGKIQIVRNVEQFVQNLKKSGIIGKIILQSLQLQLGNTLGVLNKNLYQQKQKLSQINVSKTQYNKFGNWIINIVGKIHKIPFAILFDNESKQDLVCIIPTKTPQQLQSSLKTLKLPTQYTQIQQKHSYKKIHLNNQTISFKFDDTQISKQEITQFNDENFGIDKPETEQKQTWVLGVYRKIYINQQQDQSLILILPLDKDLIQKQQIIELSINQTEIKAEIQFKILQAKIRKGEKVQQDEIIRQINSQKYANVYLNDKLTVTALGRWLKNQLKKYKDKKKAEKEQAQLLLRQQKQKQEQQRKKQEERLKKLEEQRIKKQQQQRIKRQQQQRVKKLQQLKKKDAEFMLAEENNNPSSNTIKQQSNQYLKKLYKELTDKKIYKVNKDIINAGIKQKKDHSGIQLKSNKHIEIKQGTQKTIQSLQSNLEGEDQKQFHKIAQNYLGSMQEFIYQRQKILDEVLQLATQMKEGLQQDGDQQQYIISALKIDSKMTKVIEQISSRPDYKQSLKEKIKKVVNSLTKQKKQKLYSIYIQTQ